MVSIVSPCLTLFYDTVFFLSARFHSDEENRKKTKDRKPTLIDIVPRLSGGEGWGGGFVAPTVNSKCCCSIFTLQYVVAVNKLIVLLKHSTVT
jgi:hypothetical protein